MLENQDLMSMFTFGGSRLINVGFEPPEDWGVMVAKGREQFAEGVIYDMMMALGVTSMPTSLFESAKQAIAAACDMAESTHKVGFAVCSSKEMI